jgi:hypothetical protein
MKNFIISKSGKLDIDRTFNLGQFYVITIVFKNHRLIRKETKDNPDDTIDTNIKESAHQ